MASSADTVLDNPPTLGCPSMSLPPNPSLKRGSDEGLGHDGKLSNRSSHPTSVTRPFSFGDTSQDITNDLSQAQGTVGCELSTITAGVIISIQVQLLTSSAIASSIFPRIFLALGLMSEQIAVMLIISSIRIPENQGRKHCTIRRTTTRFVSELLTFLIFMGIICVAAALVADMQDVSTGTAIAMGCVLIAGVLLCPFVVLGHWWKSRDVGPNLN